MKIELWAIGNTNEQYLTEGIKIFEKRLKHYCKFEIVTIKDVKEKRLDPQTLKKKEGEQILKKLDNGDVLVILDEKGKQFTSVEYAKQLQKWKNQSPRRLIFLIGGAFGFDKAIYERANQKISLSDMTFSHQMIRLFYVEQLYRAYTILNNEPYHNT